MCIEAFGQYNAFSIGRPVGGKAVEVGARQTACGCVGFDQRKPAGVRATLAQWARGILEEGMFRRAGVVHAVQVSEIAQWVLPARFGEGYMATRNCPDGVICQLFTP